jgi:hypothetical protein
MPTKRMHILAACGLAAASLAVVSPGEARPKRQPTLHFTIQLKGQAHYNAFTKWTNDNGCNASYTEDTDVSWETTMKIEFERNQTRYGEGPIEITNGDGKRSWEYTIQTYAPCEIGGIDVSGTARCSGKDEVYQGASATPRGTAYTQWVTHGKGNKRRKVLLANVSLQGPYRFDVPKPTGDLACSGQPNQWAWSAYVETEGKGAAAYVPLEAIARDLPLQSLSVGETRDFPAEMLVQSDPIPETCKWAGHGEDCIERLSGRKVELTVTRSG